MYDHFHASIQQIGAISRNSVNRSDYRYKFTGKERDEETNWDYFGARYYDSRIARWMSVDPLEQYSSPYLYCNNRPVTDIDPDGRLTTEQLQSRLVTLLMEKKFGMMA